MRITLRGLAVESDWRDEALRTNLWLIPAIESVAAVMLFAVTISIDEAAFHGALRLPPWVISGSPDAARQILSSLAGAIITVVGVVFSIMIVTLTLASQQFGPRMLRTFIRDRDAQVTLGTFVATFFYAMLALISIGSSFVPHLSVTVALALTAIDLGVLIYFIHHIATAIQLPAVIASIARDLASAIDAEAAPASAGADASLNDAARSTAPRRKCCWPGWTARAASWRRRPAATCGSSGTRRWYGSPPSTTPSSGCTTGPGTSSPGATPWRPSGRPRLPAR